SVDDLVLHSFPTRRSSDLDPAVAQVVWAVGDDLPVAAGAVELMPHLMIRKAGEDTSVAVPVLERDERADLVEQLVRHREPPLPRSEEHTSELQSPDHLVCR